MRVRARGGPEHGRKTGAPVTKKNRSLNIQVEKFVSLNYLFGTKRKNAVGIQINVLREREMKQQAFFRFFTRANPQQFI